MFVRWYFLEGDLWTYDELDGDRRPVRHVERRHTDGAFLAAASLAEALTMRDRVAYDDRYGVVPQPSVTYAARRPAATQARAGVVETTRGRNRAAKPRSASNRTARKAGSSGVDQVRDRRRIAVALVDTFQRPPVPGADDARAVGPGARRPRTAGTAPRSGSADRGGRR